MRKKENISLFWTSDLQIGRFGKNTRWEQISPSGDFWYKSTIELESFTFVKLESELMGCHNLECLFS